MFGGPGTGGGFGIWPYIAGFLIHGRHARILGQSFKESFGQIFDRVFGIENTVYSTTGTEEYSVQYYRDGKIQFYCSTGMEKKGGNNHALKIPSY